MQRAYEFQPLEPVVLVQEDDWSGLFLCFPHSVLMPPHQVLHPELKFLVTRIGCGIAAFTPEEIAPLFEEALDYDNVILPKEFADIINDR